MSCSWYKLASINPWSIFSDIHYYRSTGRYFSGVIFSPKLNSFVNDVTDGKLLVVNVGTKEYGRLLTIRFDLSDYDKHKEDPDGEMERLQNLIDKVSQSLDTLGDKLFRLPDHKEFWWPYGINHSPRCKLSLYFYSPMEVTYE
jgi:hypothetical protein